MRGVRVSNLEKRFGDVVAVSSLTMDFEKGTLTTILGPSGCGKTTTLRCIAGLEEPDTGEISVGENVVFSRQKNVPPEKRDIGLVFQSYAIWPHMTVRENIAYPLKIRRLPVQEQEIKVRKMIDMVRLNGVEDKPATQISGGQQQRVALARALIFDPKVLLLDEPLSNLDANLRDYVRVELKSIQRALGITTIYVTHDQIEALSISDKIAVMNQGRMTAFGTPREIYSKPPNEFVASFVGKANLIPGKVSSSAGGRFTIETKVGQVACSAGSTMTAKEGEAVLVTIRPENIVLQEAGNIELANTFGGRVEFIAYLGAFSEFIVMVGEQRLRAIRNSEGEVLREGQDVSVTLPEERCSLLRLEDDAPSGIRQAEPAGDARIGP